jgi:hypothetical protein
LIYSWTPREYRNFLKGARLREIDERELAVTAAVIAGRASNNPKVKPSKIFDAIKARRSVLEETVNDKKYDTSRYKKAMSALKNLTLK